MELNFIFLISARPTGNFQGSTALFMALFAIIALVLLGVGGRLYQKRKAWIEHSKLTYGKVVEISRRYARGDHAGRFPIYFPIVSYHVNGLEFRREAERGLMKNYEIGQEIPVRYLSEKPYEASLNDQSVPVLSPNVFFILGLLMLISAIILSVIHP
ncbi:DUF3592 domain-containing protein [Aquirufa nivalisilvae]|jgi:hypothetical protein|uniref:DUF3592 domain-containing protein n=1 Tax=Aquirufa nivalisilvae TaxID=2516557 RepID=A0A2S2DSS1_9BACT|nr:DUF3592 domain-containing protein [Aquirufa nivalisilvae]AWL08415.1 hypothetical protein HME7025_00543 [Aquirufa nivalisilvae]MCZ2478887.1 DUF3592 domain-containing protein [Aquirufa nivalisilvae]MCZ2483621.1 DUF3592 domain-containing protein [Aquirufa nivalisilvae]TBH75817.1 DUF3592 domain-containing protein [Aquirufa nivalisilvae]